MKLTRRVLYNRAKPFDFEYPFQNQEIANQMLDFMTRSNGIGLAATQIGISKRLFVMKIDDQVWQCFNPEIVNASEIQNELAEGCLSFPDQSCIIYRPREVSVKYQTADGRIKYEDLEGLPARCFQHEYDHLDGLTMFDRQKGSHAT